MRTKALLCAAAMAAGAVTSMAQSNVYSLNVVGYVNYPFTITGDYYLVNNPLDNTNNDLNTIMPVMPNGSAVALWSVAAQDFSTLAPVYFTSGGGHWVPNATVSPGQGYFVIPNAPCTNTFIGNVRQNPVTITLVGSGNYECLGSTVPLAGGVTNQVGPTYPALNGDALAIWSVAAQDFSTVAPVFFTSGGGHWTPDYNFTPGEGFFLIKNGPGVSFTRTFTVQ
jgi:hypothetical protein